MATATLQRNTKRFFNGNSINEEIYVKMPQSDIVFFQLFAKKMGWLVTRRKDFWEEYIKNSPKDVPLTDEEIMEEVRAVRYGKM